MRNLAIVALGGCGLAARAERQKQMAAAVATAQQGYADCKTQFPEESKQALDRNKCSYEVAKLNIRPFVTYPDLFDTDWAEKLAVAEKLQAGKITFAEANQQATEHHSQIVAEEQRRNLSNRSVTAQESAAAAAWAASGPVTCNRVGNTATCF
jgi:tryptophanyl-tRNA synthetase